MRTIIWLLLLVVTTVGIPFAEIQAKSKGEFQALKLEDTLQQICTSKNVSRYISLVIDEKMGQKERREQLIQRRLRMRHEISKDLMYRSLKISKELMPLLAIGTYQRGNHTKYKKESINHYLPKSCDYYESTEPDFFEDYREQVGKLDKAQDAWAKVFPTYFFRGLKGDNDSFFKSILMHVYELRLLSKIDELFHHNSLQFNIPNPSKLVFPAIYPIDPFNQKMGYPLERINNIFNQMPYLKRPGAYFGPVPTANLAQELFEQFFKMSDHGYGPKSFFTEDNGNQKEATDPLGKMFQWGRGKVQKLQDGKPHFQQLVADLTPFLSSRLKQLFEISNYELYKFLKENDLEIDGEHISLGTEDENGYKVHATYSHNISPNQRRLIAMWQLFLKHDIAHFLKERVEKAYHKAFLSNGVIHNKSLNTMLNVAKNWMKDLRKATNKICSVDSARELEFVEEHPHAVAHHIMLNADRIEDHEFIENLDGFCNAGSVKHPDAKHIDYWLAKPWGMTRRTQKENFIMTTSTVLVITGGMINKAAGPLHFIPYFGNVVATPAHLVGGALIATGATGTAAGAIMKLDHVLEKLMFDSALSNPNIKKRQLEQAGAAFHFITAPLYFYGSIRLGAYIASAGLGFLVAPPGSAQFSLIFKNTISGAKNLIQHPSKIFPWLMENASKLSPAMKKALSNPAQREIIKKNIMSASAFGLGFVAITIKFNKFKERGMNPWVEPGFWAGVVQTYLEQVLLSKMVSMSSSLKGYAKLVFYTQLESLVIDRMVQYSMSLFSGRLPNPRYMELTIQWTITKQFTSRPFSIGAYHMLKMLTGKSVFGYLISMTVWDYIIVGYPLLNGINSVFTDYLQNEEVGFFQAWRNLKFEDLHIRAPGSKVCKECEENMFDTREIVERGILSNDEHFFEATQFLGNFYAEFDGVDNHDPKLDELFKTRLRIREESTL